MNGDEETIRSLIRGGARATAHHQDGLRIDPITQAKNIFVAGWIGEYALAQANARARVAHVQAMAANSAP
jgi:hypothetical protein